MRSTTLIVLLTTSLVLAGAPAETYASVRSASVKAKEEAIFKRKKKGYRKKRGFMWGLFKKKDCGCPKH